MAAPQQGLTGPVAADSSATHSLWLDVEPLLKWAAVAYAAGFMTVMLHTARLGIPVLQVIDPVNVWIGLPIAGVLFFVGKIYNWYRRATIRLRHEIEEARQMQRVVTAVEAAGLIQPAIRLLADSLATLVLVTPVLTGVVASGLANAIGKIVTERLNREADKNGTDNANRAVQAVLKIAKRLLFLARVTTAVIIFANVAVAVIAIPTACAAYVWYVYPALPQTIGGGKPIEVDMLLDFKGSLADPQLAATLLPGLTPSQSSGTPGAPSTSSKPVRVTLHYRTDDRYYISRGSGPIVALKKDIPEALIFPK